jgi:hypothetical protein
MLASRSAGAILCILAVAGCHQAARGLPPEVLLTEDFNGENDGIYSLNYTAFARWVVLEGTVDLVGTPPYDDFLPSTQGLYVDLDGTRKAAGTLRSRESFNLPPGIYRLQFRLSGTPRPNQPDNTVVVSLGNLLDESITLASYAPLGTYVHTFRVVSPSRAYLAFRHLGGDDYGIFVDDIRLERL